MSDPVPIPARQLRDLAPMSRRILVLDLWPASPPMPRPTPLLLLPLGGDRAAVALDDLSAEEVLAELLSRGVAVRGSRVVEA